MGGEIPFGLGSIFWSLHVSDSQQSVMEHGVLEKFWLSMCSIQYFSIRVIALLDFNDVACCINIGHIQLKWV